jgi:hypothetical protein
VRLFKSLNNQFCLFTTFYQLRDLPPQLLYFKEQRIAVIALASSLFRLQAIDRTFFADVATRSAKDK